MTPLHRSSVVRHMLPHATRLASRSVCAGLCGLFVVLASATSLAARQPFSTSTSSPSHAAATEPPATDGATFRLGNAARPFGWSTVIGDFNTDGKPDVAIADHVARRAGSYQYRIDFSVSGEALDGFTFESIQDAVTITAADVDRDLDLDIVIVHPISGETVGIWLNDGHGHFTGVDVSRAARLRQTQQTIQATGPTIDLEPFDFWRQQHVGVSVTVQPASVRSRHRASSCPGQHRPSSLTCLRTAPRGPPILSQHGLLS